MSAEAVSRASSAGLPVSYCVGDAHHLGFADNAFSGANVSRVLQHLSNPRATLAEAARVVRSSGKIVVGEPDWETLVVNAENRDLTRRIVNFMCDCRVRNGWMGRQLPSLFQEAGFADIVVDSITGILRDLQQADRLWGFRRNAHRACDAGVVSTSERDEWTRNLEALDANHAFFSSLSGFMVVGRVP
jgi:SAM-dependent methyltransferase